MAKRKPPKVRQREVLERVRLATVGLGLYKTGGDGLRHSISGTGFFIDKPAGIIVTASHVIEGIMARTDKPKWAGYTPGILICGGMAGTGIRVHMTPLLHAEGNADHDIAAVVPARDIAPPALLRLDYNMAPREGFTAATCGWPHGFEPPGAPKPSGFQSVATFLWGPISSVLPWPTIRAEGRDAYIVQMPATQGNSGGAVFDPATGNVFGVVQRKIAVNEYRTGLTAAGAIRYARDLVERVAAHPIAQSSVNP